MNSTETLRLQALKLKQLTTRGSDIPDDLVDAIIKQNPSEELPLRNVCAFVSHQLFDEIEGLCNTLSISKRRFVEMALIDLIAKANVIIEEVQPFEVA
jgi:hypothetical protein